MSNSKEIKVKYHGNKDKKSKGRKKNPNVADISKQGYRDDSPYRSLPYIDIYTPSGRINMSNTGIPLWANGRILPPYSGIHQFDTTQVKEIPLAQKGRQTRKLQPWEYVDKEGKIWNDMAKIPLDPQGRTKYAESLDWMKNWISQRKPQMLSLMKGHMAEMDEKHPVDAWARKYIYSPLFGKASAYKLTDEWGEDDLGKLVNQKLNKAIGNINTVQFVDDSKIAGDTYTSGLGSYSPYSHRIKFSWPDENVQVHEIGHSSKLEEEPVVRSFIRRTIENDPVYKKKRDSYYHDPGEIYSRIWELRRGLNIKPNEKITKESLKKKLEKEKDRYDIDEYINIFRHLDTDTIINLLNGLVYQENTSKEEIPLAQKGLIVNDPNDPRLKAYQDSSRLNAMYPEVKGYWKPNEMVPEYFNKLTKKYSKGKIKPIGVNPYKVDSEDLHLPVFKKPVQSVTYQPLPSVAESTSSAKPIIIANTIDEIMMPSGQMISRKEFIKRYGQAAWDRATNQGRYKKQGGSLPLAQTGRNIRVYTDPNQFRIAEQAYRDSLTLYNSNRRDEEFVRTAPRIRPNVIDASSWKDYRINIPQNQIDAYNRLTYLNDEEPANRSDRRRFNISYFSDGDSTVPTWYSIYKKPVVQPVYQSRPKLEPVAVMPMKQLTIDRPEMQLVQPSPVPPAPAFRSFSAAGYPMVDVHTGKSGTVSEGYYEGSEKEKKYRGKKQKGGWLKKYQMGSETGFIGPEEEPKSAVVRQIGVDAEGNPIQRPTTGYYLPTIDITAEKEDTYNNYMADKYRDAGLGEALFMAPLDYVFGYPQAAMTKLFSGKYQLPSEAMGIENPIGAIATDVLLDPANLVGAGLFTKERGFLKGFKGVPKELPGSPNASYMSKGDVAGTVDFGYYPKLTLQEKLKVLFMDNYKKQEFLANKTVDEAFEYADRFMKDPEYLKRFQEVKSMTPSIAADEADVIKYIREKFKSGEFKSIDFTKEDVMKMTDSEIKDAFEDIYRNNTSGVAYYDKDKLSVYKNRTSQTPQQTSVQHLKKNIVIDPYSDKKYGLYAPNKFGSTANKSSEQVTVGGRNLGDLFTVTVHEILGHGKTYGSISLTQKEKELLKSVFKANHAASEYIQKPTEVMARIDEIRSILNRNNPFNPVTEADLTKYEKMVNTSKSMPGVDEKTGSSMLQFIQNVDKKKLARVMNTMYGFLPPVLLGAGAMEEKRKGGSKLRRHQTAPGQTGSFINYNAALNQANSSFQPSSTRTNVPAAVVVKRAIDTGEVAANRKAAEEARAREIASGKGTERMFGLFDIPVTYSGIERQNAETLGKKKLAAETVQGDVYQNLLELGSSLIGTGALNEGKALAKTAAKTAEKVSEPLSETRLLINQMKNEGIIPADANAELLEKYPNLFSNVVKRGVKDKLTVSRNVVTGKYPNTDLTKLDRYIEWANENNKLRGMPLQTREELAEEFVKGLDEHNFMDKALMKVNDAGPDNPEAQSLYMATHYPHGRYGNRSGLKEILGDHDALYHYTGPGNYVNRTYGNHIVTSRYPFEYSGSASDIFDRYNAFKSSILHHDDVQFDDISSIVKKIPYGQNKVFRMGHKPAIGIGDPGITEMASVGVPGTKAFDPLRTLDLSGKVTHYSPLKFKFYKGGSKLPPHLPEAYQKGGEEKGYEVSIYPNLYDTPNRITFPITGGWDFSTKGIDNRFALTGYEREGFGKRLAPFVDLGVGTASAPESYGYGTYDSQTNASESVSPMGLGLFGKVGVKPSFAVGKSSVNPRTRKEKFNTSFFIEPSVYADVNAGKVSPSDQEAYLDALDRAKNPTTVMTDPNEKLLTQPWYASINPGARLDFSKTGRIGNIDTKGSLGVMYDQRGPGVVGSFMGESFAGSVPFTFSLEAGYQPGKEGRGFFGGPKVQIPIGEGWNKVKRKKQKASSPRHKQGGWLNQYAEGGPGMPTEETKKPEKTLGDKWITSELEERINDPAYGDRAKYYSDWYKNQTIDKLKQSGITKDVIKKSVKALKDKSLDDLSKAMGFDEQVTIALETGGLKHVYPDIYKDMENQGSLNKIKDTLNQVGVSNTWDLMDSIYPSVMDLRYNLGVNPSDVITEDTLDNFYKTKGKDKSSLDRLLKIYSKPKLVEMMNTVAENKQDGMQPPIAKKGRSLKKYQDGSDVDLEALKMYEEKLSQQLKKLGVEEEPTIGEILDGKASYSDDIYPEVQQLPTVDIRATMPEHIRDQQKSQFIQNLGNLDTGLGYELTVNDAFRQGLYGVGPYALEKSNQAPDYDPPILSENDALRLYLGLNQNYGSFMPSKYEKGAYDFAEGYQKLFPEKLPKDEKEIQKYLDNADDGKGLMDKSGKHRIANPFTPYGDFVMGRHQLRKGSDKKGDYIEYYDEWDLDTLGMAGVLADKTVGKPFKIRGRVYYDKKTGKRMDEYAPKYEPELKYKKKGGPMLPKAQKGLRNNYFQRNSLNQARNQGTAVRDNTNAPNVPQRVKMQESLDQIDRDLNNMSDDQFRNKYGLNKHGWQYKNRPAYKAKVDADIVAKRKQGIPEIKKEVKVNPNMMFMAPNATSAEQAQNVIDYNLGVIGAALPIPGLQSIKMSAPIAGTSRELPSLLSMTSKVVNPERIINNLPISKENKLAIFDHIGGLKLGLSDIKRGRPFFETFPITKAQKKRIMKLQDEARDDAEKFVFDYIYGPESSLKRRDLGRDIDIETINKMRAFEPTHTFRIKQGDFFLPSPKDLDDINFSSANILIGPEGVNRPRLISPRRSAMMREVSQDPALSLYAPKFKQHLMEARSNRTGWNTTGLYGPNITLRGHGLYYHTPREIAETVTHEMGHNFQKMGVYNHPVRTGKKSFKDIISIRDEDITPYTFANTNTPIGNRIELAMVEPKRWDDELEKITQKHFPNNDYEIKWQEAYVNNTLSPNDLKQFQDKESLMNIEKEMFKSLNSRNYHTWEASPLELHSELMTARYKAFKQLKKQFNITDEEALDIIRSGSLDDLAGREFMTDGKIKTFTPTPNYLEKYLIQGQGLNRFFKDATPDQKKYDLIRILPALGGLGLAGSLYESPYEKEGLQRQKTGGPLPKAQTGIPTPPASYYKRLYGSGNDLSIRSWGTKDIVTPDGTQVMHKGYRDPSTGYIYFSDEANLDRSTGQYIKSNQQKEVPESKWNTSRFLFDPFIRGAYQGQHDQILYDTEYGPVAAPEPVTDVFPEVGSGTPVMTPGSSIDDRFMAAKQDITNYYKYDVGLNEKETKKKVKDKMKDLRQMYDAYKSMKGLQPYKFEDSAKHGVFNLAVDPDKQYYWDHETKDINITPREAKKAYVKFQKAWRDTPGREARKNARQELKNARERFKEQDENWDVEIYGPKPLPRGRVYGPPPNTAYPPVGPQIPEAYKTGGPLPMAQKGRTIKGAVAEFPGDQATYMGHPFDIPNPKYDPQYKIDRWDKVRATRDQQIRYGIDPYTGESASYYPPHYGITPLKEYEYLVKQPGDIQHPLLKRIGGSKLPVHLPEAYKKGGWLNKYKK